jgi:short-subunit dehydrogenase
MPDEALREYLAPEGVSVSLVYPGYISKNGANSLPYWRITAANVARPCGGDHSFVG